MSPMAITATSVSRRASTGGATRTTGQLAKVIALPVTHADGLSEPAQRALTAFHRHLDICDLADNSKDAYRRAVKFFFAWVPSWDGYDEAFLDAVGAQGAAAAYKWFLLDRRRSAATIAQALAAITLMFDVGCGFRIKVKGAGRAELGEPDALSDAEVGRLRRTAARAGIRETAIIELFLGTGARLEEVLKLELSDIPLTDRGGSVRLVGKGGKIRHVKVPTDARRAVQAWLRLRTTLPGTTDSDRVWWATSNPTHGWRGRPMTRNGLRKLITKLFREAKIPRGGAHRCRHTFATRLRKDGVDYAVISKLLGHTSVETTARYFRASQAEMDSEVDRVLG